jgi:hypothetical protein
MPPSGGATTPSTNATADDHFGYVHWDEATLPALNVVTPKEPGEKVETPEDLLKRTLHVSEWRPGLTLLYFHTPHDDLQKDKIVGAALATLKQCKTFHQEDVVRWLSLYHPVEVDMGKSDAKTAERLGAKEGVIFSVIDENLNVVATSKPLPESEGVSGFLKTTLKSDKATKYWAPIQEQIDQQKAALEKARALVAQKKFKEALEQYDLVVKTTVFVADFWDDAAKERKKIEAKAKDAK